MSAQDVVNARDEIFQCVERLKISKKNKERILRQAEAKLNIWIMALGGEIQLP